jgi:hypothetical protein
VRSDQFRERLDRSSGSLGRNPEVDVGDLEAPAGHTANQDVTELLAPARRDAVLQRHALDDQVMSALRAEEAAVVSAHGGMIGAGARRY